MNVFQLFFGSFHSSAAYRQMRANASFGMGYALLVVTICSLFVLLYYSSQVYTAMFLPRDGKPAMFDQMMQDVADQMPVMTMKSGTLATKNPEATIITIKGSYGTENFNVPIATIDTTGKTDTSNATTPVLINAKQLLVRDKGNWSPQMLTDFTKNAPDTIIINHAVAEEMATAASSYIHNSLAEYFILAWFFFIICLYVVSFFLLLVLGCIGLVIASLVRSPLSFGAAVGLASLSFTPVAILNVLLLTAFGYAAHTITLLVAGTVTLYAAIRSSDPATRPAVL